MWSSVGFRGCIGGLSIGKAYVSVEKQPVFDADTISRMRFQMTADSVTWTWRDKWATVGFGCTCSG